MKLAFITFSREGRGLGALIAKKLPDVQIYLHESVTNHDEDAIPFESVMTLAAKIFHDYEGLIFCAPCGLAVRAIAPHIEHKKKDPAVVVLDILARYAVSLLSGHEGGANGLALELSNLLGAEPVISTSTEAAKTIIVGVGCRRGVESERIIESINQGLAQAGLDISQVRTLASADIKNDEAGLIEAARVLGLPLRFIPSEEIKACRRMIQVSEFVTEKTGLPAVAEPAALLAGRRTTLVLPKTKFRGVTIAIARESSM